jgi:hypothetical protein
MTFGKPLKILGTAVAIIVGLSFMALRREKRKENWNNVIKADKTSIQQLNYKSVKIGSSNLYIKLPFDLTPSTVNHPKSTLDNLTKSEVFFFSKDKTFEGKVSYMVWKAGVEFSVEKGTDAAIANIKTLPGIEKVLDEREYFKKGVIEGCIYDAVIYRYGKSFQMKGATLKSGQETWAVLITFLEHKDEHIATTILNSLK